MAYRLNEINNQTIAGTFSDISRIEKNNIANGLLKIIDKIE